MKKPSGETEIEQQYHQMVDQAQQTTANAADSTASVISTGAPAAFVAPRSRRGSRMVRWSLRRRVVPRRHNPA